MKKRFGAIILSLVAILLILTGCGSTSSAKNEKKDDKNPSSVEAIKERGKLKVAVFGDLSPYGYVDSSGKNQGYDVYLAKRLAKDLLGDESKIEFVVVNAEERVDALKSNKVDIVLANFTKTADREKVVDFASPYMKVGIGVVSPKSAAITDAKQLDGKKLIVTKGTTSEIFFSKEYPSINLEKYESKNTAISSSDRWSSRCPC